MSDSESQSEPEESNEGQLAMKKRLDAQRQISSSGLDEAAKELLESNRQDRAKMDEEIEELRKRNEKRKKQREQQEKRLASERAAEDERRKAAEEDKRRKKEEDDQKKLRERAKKMAEFEKWKNPTGPNFVIRKSDSGKDEDEGGATEAREARKSKEQLEAEKQAILKQRIQPLGTIEGLDMSKLTEKGKELLKLIYRLEGEKYDLEKRFKAQQVDMMELAEKARQANKVGKGGLKRIQQLAEEVDKIQERFAGTPAKIEMYSKYERQKDKRPYKERKNQYSGPQFLYPAERIPPAKAVKWDEDGLPIYEPLDEAVDAKA